MSKGQIVGLKSTLVVLGMTAIVTLVTNKLLSIQYSAGALLGTVSIMVYFATSAAYKQGLNDQQVGENQS